MGTRSLTIIKDNDKDLLVMYRQHDGYLSGHGADLRKRFRSHSIVNGISEHQSAEKFANGMGCLAAQVVAHFKDRIGGIYIHPADSRDCGEDFTYTLYITEQPEFQRPAVLKLKAQDGETTIYDGPISEFDPAQIEAATANE